MGNKKNSRGSHISNGKYCRKSNNFTKNKTTVANNTCATFNTSRIINLDKLQSHLSTISRHAATCHYCQTSKGEILLAGEKYRAGFASILTSCCTGCNKKFSFPTTSKVSGMTGGQYWETNLAAVWGQMATGNGHSPLSEAMAVMGVPTMTKASFVLTERHIGEWWWELLQESMKAAGEEEKNMAIANNNFHQNVPAITVIVDGGWSKRTNKHNYNAKSGVGIIIGKATGKILFMGIRNKFCSICTRANNTTSPIPEHQCFKNWSCSSSEMETDIILEGFQMCEQQHGVRYISFIGDGDSSVYPTLISSIPWGYAITKIECANHCVKCYRTALEKLVQDKPSYKGRGKLTEVMRKRLTRAARCAIIMRSKETNQQQAIANLRKDLLNGPLHCFGFHSKCSTDFCKTVQQSTCASSSTALLQSAENTSANDSTLLRHTPPADVASSSATPEQTADFDDVDEAMLEQAEFWNDATDEGNLDEVRDIAHSSLADLDEGMICDIQRVVSRLAERHPS